MGGGLPHRGGDAASFRQCLKGIKDGQAADGGAYLPVQAKGPEQMLGTAAWLRCLTHDAPGGSSCKPLKFNTPEFGRFLLNWKGRVQIHAEIAAPRTPGQAARKGPRRQARDMRPGARHQSNASGKDARATASLITSSAS